MDYCNTQYGIHNAKWFMRNDLHTYLLYKSHWINKPYREFPILKISYATCCRNWFDRLFHRRKMYIMCPTYIFRMLCQEDWLKLTLSVTNLLCRSSWERQSGRQMKYADIKHHKVGTSCCKAQGRQWNFVFTIRSILHSKT